VARAEVDFQRRKRNGARRERRFTGKELECSSSRPNGVRTTVYTGEDGHYEYSQNADGRVHFAIPTPREFKPYRMDAVPKSMAQRSSTISCSKEFHLETACHRHPKLNRS